MGGWVYNLFFTKWQNFAFSIKIRYFKAVG